MNKFLFDQMLDSYILDFDSNWENEEYKWIEVKRFQENFNINCRSSEFANMLKAAVDISSNLVAGQNYYPIAEMIKLTEKYPSDVQKAFGILFDEEKDLNERVSEYIDIIKNIKKKTGTESIRDGCDDRFISTMLYYKFPEECSIYKYHEDKEFCEKFELGFNVKMGDSSNILLINDLTKSIVEYLIDENHEILNLYHKKLESNDYYNDEYGLMLAQNIIWYAMKYEPIKKDDKTPIKQIKVKHGTLTQSHYKPVVLKKGKTTDYEKAQKEKAKIGLLGEEVVIQHENERLLKDIEANEEAIVNNNRIETSLNVVNANIRESENVYRATQRSTESAKAQMGVNRKEIEESKKIIEIIEKEEKEVKKWKLYLDIVGKNGVSKLVLRTALPFINGELKRLLSGVCDFDVEVAIDDHNDVAFYLIHDDVKRSLAGGSGFEQTVASLALRSVLSKTSTFSKPSFVVFDEILGGVADENYENVKLLYDKIVADYAFIFQITHLKQIADWHNSTVVVKKENNISKIGKMK